jgi:hypothetical protein
MSRYFYELWEQTGIGSGIFGEQPTSSCYSLNLAAVKLKISKSTLAHLFNNKSTATVSINSGNGKKIKVNRTKI